MADPVSWMMIASTVASAGSQLIGGMQAYQQGKYEAVVAGQNAQIAMNNAARARQDAARAEEAQRREARQAMGRMAAAGAQSGTTGSGLGAGSFAALATQSGKAAELDALNIRYGGEMEAFGNETQAAQFLAERKAAIQRAKGGLLSGVVGAAASGLSGYADYRRTKAQNTRSTVATPRNTPTKKGVARPVSAPRYDPYHRNP